MLVVLTEHTEYQCQTLSYVVSLVNLPNKDYCSACEGDECHETQAPVDVVVLPEQLWEP